MPDRLNLHLCSRLQACRSFREILRHFTMFVFSHTIETFEKKTRILSLAVKGDISHITRTTR